MSRKLWKRKQRNSELSEEIQGHLELAEREAMESGQSASNAHAAAHQEFGSVSLAEEITREQWGSRWLTDLRQDLRIGFRMLRRSPGFSLLAILCLTLGIGANTAVFSWIEGILFRPYPLVAHQERLLAMTGTSTRESDNEDMSWPDFLDLQRNCKLFDAFIGDKIMGITLGIGDRADIAVGSIVSANYFEALGVRPILGRGFKSGEDVGSNAHPVTVISYRLWKDRYQSDPQIIGKTQRLNGVMHTIVGVAPPGFYGTFVGWAMQFWVPASMVEVFEGKDMKLEDRDARWMESYVILKPGVTRAQAQQEVSTVAKRLALSYPITNRGRDVKLWPLWQTPFNNAGSLLPTLGIMLAVVVFVLLIACSNVGNLLLVRSFARKHEMSVRAAIGAGRGRLFRQLLTEGLILSALGAGGGLLLSYWCRHALVLLFPVRSGRTMYLPGEIDWRVLALSAGLALAVTLLLGLVPAIQTSKINLAGALKSEMGGVIGGSGKSYVRSGLVLVQVSLSFLLLVATGLVMQSLRKIQNVSPGFSTHGVLTTGVDLTAAGYTIQRATIFQDQLIDRVQSLPGVDSAAFGWTTPLGYLGFPSTPISTDDFRPPPEEQPRVEYNPVGPGYFATLGIPVLSGREFTRADNENAPLVAVVNQTMVNTYWHGRDPIGKHVQVNGKWAAIVGVAKDSKYESIREAPKPFFYVPLRQKMARQPPLYIRTSFGPAAMATTLTQVLHDLDPNLALYEVISMQEQVDRSTSTQRVGVTLLGILGGLALILAAIGIYAVMSYAVSQRTRELGLRMALGARPPDLLSLVLSRGLLLAGCGVLVGAAASLALTRLLGSLLYNVSPRDPLAFGVAFAVMAFVSLLACLLPALRAVRIDPVRALQNN